MFRIMKECILKRVMAFNLSQFADFIITRFEMYFQKRLIDFCHDRYANYTVRNLEALTTDKDFIIKGKSDTDTYYLHDSVKKEDITVDISNGMCSCFRGNSGNLCEHSSYLLKRIEDTVKTNFKCSTKETKKILFFVANGTMPPPQWFDPMVSVPSLSVQIPQFSSQSSNTPEEMNICSEKDDAPSFETAPLTEEEKVALKSFYKRIDDGLEKDPENYIPAVRKLLANVNSTKTDTSFLSALHTFGKYGHQSIKCANKLLKRSRSHGKTICVQPTALGCRAKNITGQKIVKAGRPKKTSFHSTLKEHDYTTFGNLPKRKRKATHNLEDCVLSNKSLGD